MDNPRHSESYDLPRRFSYEDPADNDFYENITSTETSDNKEASLHDLADNNKVTIQGSADKSKKPSNDRSDNYKAPSHDKSHRYKELTTSQPVGLPEPYQKKNISDWIRSYKQLLLGIIGGCLLTILIVVPVVYFSTKSKYETDSISKSVTDNYIPMKFDQSTLYHTAFMSEDGLKLSNTYSRDTPVSSVKNPNTLSEYRGVIGNRCFDRNSKIYFEVQYEFRVIGKFNTNNLIFEVGLAERERVDNHHYVGTTDTRGWSFFLKICSNVNNTACLGARHNDDYLINPFPWLQITSSPESKYSGNFGFFVNTNKEKFSIVRNSSTAEQVINSFESVSSIRNLCPVFGVFNPASFEVHLTLLNTYEFSSVT